MKFLQDSCEPNMPLVISGASSGCGYFCIFLLIFYQICKREFLIFIYKTGQKQTEIILHDKLHNPFSLFVSGLGVACLSLHRQRKIGRLLDEITAGKNGWISRVATSTRVAVVGAR
jgi:hypothetical protein